MDLSALVDRVKTGDLDLQPDFQRGEVWSESKKQRLIDTILRDWYVPAIHIVINDELDREEVLDGQQRLKAIIDFMDDKFPVNGRIEPFDQQIIALDGTYYSQLPLRTKSRFRRFTIATIRLRDYLPEEPGELFFRLNQLTALTSAEQRNALIGPPRNQIKELVDKLVRALGGYSLGFSNARMNYDDTLARLALTLEQRDLGAKVTAASLEKRYRSGASFPPDVLQSISSGIEAIASTIAEHSIDIRLNRASLFSWLFFCIDYDFRASEGYLTEFRSFFMTFEIARGTIRRSKFNDPGIIQSNFRQAFDTALLIFNDRASSRVNDVASVVLRDMCLACGFAIAMPTPRVAERFGPRAKFIERAIIALNSFPSDVAERPLVENQLARQWEQMREVG